MPGIVLVTEVSEINKPDKISAPTDFIYYGRKTGKNHPNI